jgi:hypothetical protein
MTDCPTWCTRDHSEDDTLFRYHSTRRPATSGVIVVLILDAQLAGQDAPPPRLLIMDTEATAPPGEVYASTFVGLKEAPHLAAIFAHLRQKGLAKIITELVQLAGAQS